MISCCEIKQLYEVQKEPQLLDFITAQHYSQHFDSLSVHSFFSSSQAQQSKTSGLYKSMQQHVAETNSLRVIQQNKDKIYADPKFIAIRVSFQDASVRTEMIIFVGWIQIFRSQQCIASGRCRKSSREGIQNLSSMPRLRGKQDKS